MSTVLAVSDTKSPFYNFEIYSAVYIYDGRDGFVNNTQTGLVYACMVVREGDKSVSGERLG